VRSAQTLSWVNLSVYALAFLLLPAITLLAADAPAIPVRKKAGSKKSNQNAQLLLTVPAPTLPKAPDRSA